ncbi:MAG: sugar transferase [Cyanobacteria bacterium J06632_22]
MGKRVVDVALSLLGVLVLGVCYGPIAIAIRLDTPGPVIYRQQRIGLGGKPFTIYKFRSMVAQADRLKALVKNEASGQIFKNQNDPRITRVGRFLRSTSLDELPQLINVLRGEMSLVGTRPPTAEEVAAYQPHHLQRLRVKPGLTGEWQVRGRSSVSNFDRIVQMDLAYQRKWSLAYDLRLLVKTVGVVLNRQGAY